MDTTNFEIIIAVTMLAVNIAIFVWFQSSRAADSARRMMGMMVKFRLNPRMVTQDSTVCFSMSPETKAIIKTAQWRCKRCPVEGHCDRWLCGKVEGSNTFCPNQQTFNLLSVT